MASTSGCKRKASDTRKDDQNEGKKQKSRDSFDAIKSHFGYKRKASDTLKDDQYEGKKQKSRGSFDAIESYASVGLKNMLHGISYQLRILMLFVIRGLGNEYTFKMATEFKDAEKFDDVVFKYRNKEGKMIYRFLQAKHKQSNHEKITFNDLTENKANKDQFYLKKYYISYHKIKRNPVFNDNNSELKDFIIYTNIGFDENLLKNSTEITNEDHLLDQDKTHKSRSRKLSIETDRVKELVASILKDILESKHSFMNMLSEQEIKAEINEFLDKLIFAVDQPDEIELEKIIKKSIGNEFKANSFETFMFNWMKSKEAAFLNDKESQKFFQSITSKLAKLILTGASVDCINSIENLNMKFEQQATKLKFCQSDKQTEPSKELCINDFLSPSSRKQILNIKTQNIDLTSAKIVQVLTDLFKTENRINDNNYIILNLNSVQSLSEYIVQTFNCQHNNLLVIICNSNVNELINIIKKINTIIEEQKKVVDEYNIKVEEFNNTIFDPDKEKENINQSSMKIILITHNQNSLKEISSDNKYQECEDNKINFIDLTGESKATLLDTIIKFQGSNVSLSELVNKELCDCLDAEVISKLINKEKVKLGNELIGLGELQNYYIERKISRVIMINETLMKESKKFFILGYHQNYDPLSDQDIVLISNDNDETQFETFCCKYKHRNIHWLIKEKQGLRWQRSFGNLFKLRDYLVTHLRKSDKLDFTSVFQNMVNKSNGVRHFKDISGKIVIIAAEPGMGKSTLMTKLAIEKKNSNLWIVRINLIDYSQQFSNWDEDKIETAEVKEFIYFCAILNKNEKNEDMKGLTLLKESVFNDFYKRGKIIVLFDGFDEISPHYKEKVIKLLILLKNENLVHLWITTRPYGIQIELENELATFSYSLESISRKNQIKFLSDYWKFNLNLTELGEQSEKLISQLLNLFSESTNDEKGEFVQVPLQLQMFAEFFQDHFKDFHNADIQDFNSFENIFKEKLNLVNLYENFINKKFYEIRWNNKKPGLNTTDPDIKISMEAGRKKFIKDHQILALHALGLGKVLNMILDVDDLLTDIKECKEKTGIIDRIVDGKPIFVHKTYAEYFVALWFSDNWEKQENVRNYLRENLFEEQNEVIRKFFDFMMIKEDNNEYKNKNASEYKYEIHKAVLNRNASKIHELLSNSQNIESIINCVDKGGRTPLHLAACSLNYNYFGYPDEIIVALLNPLDPKLKKFINIEDKIFQWTPLIYAEKLNDWPAAESLLEAGANSDKMSFKKINCINPCAKVIDSEQKLLDLFIDLTFTKLIKVLITNCKEVFARNSNDSKVFYYVASSGNFDLVKYFVRKGFNCNANRILDGAILNGNLNVVKYIINEGADTNWINYAADITPLLVAIRNGSLEITKYFIEEQSAKFTNCKKGRNVFHYAAQYGNMEVMVYLINYLKKEKPNTIIKLINAKDDTGQTPYHLAAITENTEKFKFLINYAENLNPHQLINIFVNRDTSCASLLHCAVLSGKIETVKFLIEKFIEKKFEELSLWNFITEYDEYGKIPLHYAADNGFMNIVEYFTKLTEENYPDELIDFINILDDNDYSSIYYAIRNDKLNVVKFLLEYDADIIRLTKDHESVLHIVWSTRIFELILNKIKARENFIPFINSKDKKGNSALMKNVQKNRIKICEMLLDHGADPNIQNEDNETALHCGVEDSRLSIIKLLMYKNANPNIKNNNGKTPLDLAKANMEDEKKRENYEEAEDDEDNEALQECQKIINLLSTN